MHVTKKLGGTISLKGAKVAATGRRGEFRLNIDDQELVFKAKDDETATQWIDSIKYCLRGKAGRASLRNVSMPKVAKLKRGSTLTNVDMSEEAELEHLTHLKMRAETGDYWERRASTAGQRGETVKLTVPEEDDKDFKAIHMAPPSSLVSEGPPLPPPPPVLDHTYTRAKLESQISAEIPALAVQVVEQAVQSALMGTLGGDTEI